MFDHVKRPLHQVFGSIAKMTFPARCCAAVPYSCISALLEVEHTAGKGLHAALGMQARFAKHVFPGETLRTEMWQEGSSRVIFQTRVVERDMLALTFAAVELRPEVAQATSRM